MQRNRNSNSLFPRFLNTVYFFFVRDPSDIEDAATNKKETLSSSIVVGPHTNRHSMTVGRTHLMVKVGFQLGGLYRLFDLGQEKIENA
jgi:hypothetical protein